VVHYGEGGFGTLIIEYKENDSNMFGDYRSEIKFLPKVNEKITKRYIKITLRNLNDIQYHL
jgi:hypothetical protein